MCECVCGGVREQNNSIYIYMHVYCKSGVGKGCKYYVWFSPTVPEPVPHCSTTAVYNGSTDELTDIVVSWHQAEVSYECLIMAYLCVCVYMSSGVSG